jgi:hypothetical protein
MRNNYTDSLLLSMTLWNMSGPYSLGAKYAELLMTLVKYLESQTAPQSFVSEIQRHESTWTIHVPLGMQVKRLVLYRDRTWI